MRDLANCEVVIAMSGFLLISEAVYLKKRYFAILLKGQFEQLFNSQYLQKKGFGNFSENSKKEEIEHFLNNLKRYEKNLEGHSVNPDQDLKEIEKVIKGVSNSLL